MAGNGNGNNGAACRVVLLLAMMAAVPAAWADPEAPAHDCVRPERPADDQDTARWNRFADRTDAYRACINAFVERNHRAADSHRAAANAATQEWNAFVRGSLNVPEDYPWPPEEN